MGVKKNNEFRIEKDHEKSYVYVYDGLKYIGMFAWHYSRHIWVFSRMRHRK